MAEKTNKIKLNPLKIKAEPTFTESGLAITITQEEIGTKQSITITEKMIDSLCACLLGIKTDGCRIKDEFLVGAEDEK